MRFCFISALLVVVLFAVSANCQSLTGSVTDARGDAVAGGEVTIKSDSETLRTLTADDGTFSFPTAIAGKLSVKAAGFESYSVGIETADRGPLVIVLRPAPVDATVNVTVTGIEQDQLNASIAVITIESLGVTAARTADDTLRQLAGFQLFRRSGSKTTNPTAQGANLRGVSGSGASRTAVLFDGLSLNDAFGGWTYWSRVPMIAVEQIEVLQGGGSAFYGSGALSGAVNIVPVELGDRKFLAKIESSVGSQDTADLSGIVLASRGKWQADVIGDFFTTGGYIPVEVSSRGVVDTPASSRHANVIAKLTYRFGENGQVFVRGNRFSEDRGNGTSLTNNQTEFYQLAFGADLVSERYGDFNFRVFGVRQVYDQTFSAVAADRSSESLVRLQTIPSRAGGTSLQWRKKLADHNTVASAEILKTRGFSDEVGFFNGFPSNAVHAGGKARDLSFFAQDGWKIKPKLTLNLSARVDFRSTDGIATTRSLSSGSTVETRFPGRRDVSLSPRIAAAYEVSDAVAVYASFSRSFRAPSLNELYRGFRVGNIVTEANAFLTPERSNTIEAGGSVKLFNSSSITRASVFSTRVNDPVVSVTTSSTPTLITRMRQNVGSTLSRGFEIATETTITASLKVNASYLFVDAKIDDFSAEPRLVGNRLPQTAKHSFTLQARYDLRPRWKISTQIRASSSQFEDDRNTLRLGEYFTADARVGYKIISSIEAFASFENILNARYDIGRTPLRAVSAPRSVRFGLRFDLSKR